MSKDILKKFNFLFVEDEETIKKYTVKFLEKLVNKIYVASNGKEGLDIYVENHKDIDVVITDIHMPVMNGLDMVEEIRKHDDNIPVIITTAYNETDFLKRSVELNVSSYVMKPIDLEQLINSLKRTVEPLALKQQLQEAHTILDKNEEFKKLKTIFNSQENMITIVKDNKVVDANKKLYEFFEINSINQLDSEHFFDYFVQEPGLIAKDDLISSSCWAEHIRNLHEIDRVVKIKNSKGQIKTFSLNIEIYLEEENSYILTFTDITLLKEKVNLLEYQATHDTLTGTFNRNKFHDMFEKEIRRNKRYQHDLSIILLDIDHFKYINDTYGHQIGDDVLKAIPQILNTCIREHDILSRWGGEEFMILLPETNLQNAVKVAEKIRQKIENQTFTKRYLHITSSFGVSSLNEDDTPENLINRADQALYNSKNSGRNMVSKLEK